MAKAKPKYADLQDGFIDAVIDFQEGGALELRDTRVKGLRLRLGKVKHSWTFYNQTNDHGKPVYTCVALGHYDHGYTVPGAVVGGRGTGPVTTKFGDYIGAEKVLQRGADHMDVATAREKAAVLNAHAITETLPQGQRAGMKFAEAFDSYLEYLESLAASRGKPPRWAKNVRYLGNQLILPMWTNWTLAEMSDRPDTVAGWHTAMVKRHKAVSANHAARIVRAVYRRAAKLNRKLPSELPTTGVDFFPTKRRAKGEGGMAPADFPAWFEVLHKLPAVRQSYHLTSLLTGPRPGELARTKWGDLDADTLTIGGGNLKTGNYVSVPLTPEIREAIAIAGERGDDDALIWPECSQKGHRDDLPARGMGLRRTYKTVSVMCKVDPQVSEYLMGHAPDGIGPRYILRWVIEKAETFKADQAKISAAIMQLLRATDAKRAA